MWTVWGLERKLFFLKVKRKKVKGKSQDKNTVGTVEGSFFISRPTSRLSLPLFCLFTFAFHSNSCQGI